MSALRDCRGRVWIPQALLSPPGLRFSLGCNVTALRDLKQARLCIKISEKLKRNIRFTLSLGIALGCYKSALQLNDIYHTFYFFKADAYAFHCELQGLYI